jgi:GT2 family glycosyltransferase
VLPVFHDAVGLGGCLAGLTQQTHQPLEILVVDNSDGDADVAAVASNAGVTYIVEPTPGSYAARNAAIAIARGDVFAFTDADCVPDSRWIEEGLAALARTGADAVGGRVDVVPGDAGRPSTVELHDMLFAFRQEMTISSKGYAVTANLFVRRAAFVAVGSFDASLKSGGDVDWCRRLSRSGRRLGYAEDAAVSHPARAEATALFQKARRQAGGRIDAARTLVARMKILAVHALPPFSRVRTVTRVPGLTMPQRAWLVTLQLRLQWILFHETLRLLFGGTSARA